MNIARRVDIFFVAEVNADMNDPFRFSILRFSSIEQEITLLQILEILSRFGNEAKRLHGLEPPPPAGGKSINELRNQLIGLHDRWKEKSGERFILILDEIDKWFPDRRDPNNEADLLEFVKLFRLQLCR